MAVYAAHKTIALKGTAIQLLYKYLKRGRWGVNPLYLPEKQIEVFKSRTEGLRCQSNKGDRWKECAIPAFPATMEVTLE
ncbi:hypothetical protein CD58_24945 [Pseudomonas brassicacearum]|nr:hypothetical protein CD58_24945 [Pseudomonas brassicacearum]